jgi:hypothetical protein
MTTAPSIRAVVTLRQEALEGHGTRPPACGVNGAVCFDQQPLDTALIFGKYSP